VDKDITKNLCFPLRCSYWSELNLNIIRSRRDKLPGQYQKQSIIFNSK
jgi:hypothetical protein